VVKPEAVRDKAVLIFDDVLICGLTVRDIAFKLTAAGASQAASRAANLPAARQAMKSRPALRQALDQDQREASVGETHRPLDQQAPNPLGLIRNWTRGRPRSPAVAV
jgi:hypothetical protein